MGSFLDEIRTHNAKNLERLALVQDGIDAEMFRSVVHGSEITGSPGQPVDPDNDPNAGKLRDSWTMEKEGDETILSTPVLYAPDVEFDLHGQHFRNGGPYSVTQSAAGFQAVVDIVAQKVSDAG
jgi:hypothetical protein